MKNKSTRNQKNNLEKKRIARKKDFHLLHKWHNCFHMWGCMLENLQLLLIIGVVKKYVSLTPL